MLSCRRESRARRTVFAALLWAASFFGASPAWSCPVCNSGTGQAVRAGIFGSDFVFNLAVTIVPFLIFAAIIAGIYYGPPGQWRSRSGGADADG
jgi:hypothetical protein